MHFSLVAGGGGPHRRQESAEGKRTVQIASFSFRVSWAHAPPVTGARGADAALLSCRSRNMPDTVPEVQKWFLDCFGVNFVILMCLM